MEQIEHLDRSLFFAINGWHSSFFDEFFWIVSLVLTWIPLYAYFVYLLAKKYRAQFWIPVLAAGLLAVATDQGSVFVKKSVQRYRPTHNLEIGEQVHTVKDVKGGQFGFVSSHAANTWGLAVFLILALKLFRNRLAVVLLLGWAALVSYGRVYAGVHYPSDVICGAILGVLLAIIIYKLQSIVLNRFFPDHVHSGTL